MSNFIIGFILGLFFFDILGLVKRCIEEFKIAKKDWNRDNKNYALK